MTIDSAPSALERAIQRERMLMAIGLAGTVVIAWLYLLRAADAMQAMTVEAQMHAAMGMADMRAWGLADWLGLFLMWTVMMMAMMLPSAAPMILLVLSVYRRRGDPRARVAGVTFIGGYLAVWTAFSLVASAAQVVLHRTAALTADMRFTSAMVSGALLVAAGVYQWLPVKAACLSQCQSPLGFVTRYWRDGIVGGFTLGLRHGLFCLGCCWLVMTLLFVVGVMNLLWVAALAGFVLVEKLGRGGALVTRMGGVAAAVWGVYLIASAS